MKSFSRLVSSFSRIIYYSSLAQQRVNNRTPEISNKNETKKKTTTTMERSKEMALGKENDTNKSHKMCLITCLFLYFDCGERKLCCNNR